MTMRKLVTTEPPFSMTRRSGWVSTVPTMGIRRSAISHLPVFSQKHPGGHMSRGCPAARRQGPAVSAITMPTAEIAYHSDGRSVDDEGGCAQQTDIYRSPDLGR